jgi:hypothetical protein
MQLSPLFGRGAVSRSSCPPPTGVSSLLCAPDVISILRRQTASNLGRGDPLALPLQHDLALKLGYRPDDIEE